MQTSLKALLTSLQPGFSWQMLRDYLLITAGALLQALAFRLFLIPANLINGGVSGLAQLINHFTGWPIGLMIFLGNAPLFLMGWRFLGGPRFVARTAYAIVAVSFLTDALVFFLPKDGLTHDLALNALYGGLISGVGFGLVYRGQGTSGGSDILARVLNHYRGISISTSYLLTDSLIMFLGGLVFNWEHALYALVMLYVSGVVAEAITEGSNVARTAMIITNNPQAITDYILHDMQRGVTVLSAKGGYTGLDRTVLYCVINRAEVMQVKEVVRQADPAAFLVIGHAYEALGEGFHSIDR